MDFERYRAVIHVSGLPANVARLQLTARLSVCSPISRYWRIPISPRSVNGKCSGLSTEIVTDGSGKILSGGQKARVSLARAVYSRASVLLLDDVISAVDAQTSKHIVKHCFNSDLMAGRTVIIASHAVETLAPLANHAIFLDDGKAIWSGSGADLLASEHMAHLKTTASDIQPAPDAIEGDLADEKELWEKAHSFKVLEAVPKTPKQLIVEEKRATGTVDTRHWVDLKKASGSNIFWVGMAMLLLLSVLGPVAERHALE